jgi:NRAMP (natural resistance-associated macrophage protein)-like metal ion transporter
MHGIRKFWRKLGPGLITGASDDDPSGIATYSQAGAQFGLTMLWAALITYPMMYAIQEMCARIGIVTNNGLAGVLRKHHRPFILYALLILVIPSIVLNIAADLAGMGAVVNMLIPAIPKLLVDAVVTLVSISFLIYFPYRKIANVLKYFCLTLLCYMIVPFLQSQNWENILYHTFIPSIKWEKEYLWIFVGILGTTISPYLFFWQASISREHKNHSLKTMGTELQEMQIDVNTGMFASNLAMYFIILTTGTVLFENGVNTINTVEEAAKALEPVAGKASYFLFAIGVLGVGFLSIPVLALCIGFIFSEIFNWQAGLDKKFHEAKSFYVMISASLIAGFAINLLGFDPIKMLILTAVVYGVIAPFVIAAILHICNDQKLMKGKVNTWWRNALGIAALILMSCAAIAMLVLLF